MDPGRLWPAGPVAQCLHSRMPPTERPTVAAAESAAIARVLAQFGVIGPPASVRLLAARTRHQTYLIEAGGNRWVVKRHLSPGGTDQPRSHRFESLLGERGFPVARIQHTPAGQTLVQEGAARYSLHAWVEGCHLSIADRDEILTDHPSLVESLATMVGTLHRIGSELADTGGTGSSETDRLLRAPQQLTSALGERRGPAPSRLIRLRLRPRKSDFDRWILDSMPAVVDAAAWLESQSLSSSDTGLIHNDINWENLLFDEELGVQALLDFDNTIEAPRAIEVGAAAVVLVGSDLQRVDRFVAAYEEARGTAVDHRGVDQAMVLKCTRSILVSVRSYLSGEVEDTARLMQWCGHLYASLTDLRSRTGAGS